jgi:hypothetical protein
MIDEELRTLLDGLSVIEQGEVRSTVGLVVTLYFFGGGSRDQREALVRCHDRYWEIAGANLRWGAGSKTGQPARIASGRVDPPGENLDLPPDQSFQFVYHGGVSKNDADAYSLAAHGRDLWPQELGFFTATLALEWLEGRGVGKFRELVLQFCNELHPYHGYAGLGVIHHPINSKASDLTVYGIARRFPGLEVDYPQFHILKLDNGIKGVNWLTVISDSLIDRLGTRQAFTATLSADVTVHSYAGGLVLQAGVLPQIGDTDRRNDPTAYRDVARALKPIRAEYDDAFQTNPDGFTEERTKQWLARFDDDAPSAG